MNKLAVAYVVMGTVLAIVVSVLIGVLASYTGGKVSDVSRAGGPVISKEEFLTEVQMGGWDLKPERLDSFYLAALRACRDKSTFDKLYSIVYVALSKDPTLGDFSKNILSNVYVNATAKIC